MTVIVVEHTDSWSDFDQEKAFEGTPLEDPMIETDFYVFAKDRNAPRVGSPQVYPLDIVSPIFVGRAMDEEIRKVAVKWLEEHRPEGDIWLWAHLGRSWMRLGRK